MPRFEIDVDPCDHLTSDAIGRPGQRVFYLQAYQDQRTITVIIEKAQLHSLAIGVEQFLAQIDEQNPDLPEASGDYVEDVMRINPPVDPLFRGRPGAPRAPLEQKMHPLKDKLVRIMAQIQNTLHAHDIGTRLGD